MSGAGVRVPPLFVLIASGVAIAIFETCGSAAMYRIRPACVVK